MASLDRVSRQYRGKMASGYDAKRVKQRRWHEENRIVGEMLRSIPKLEGPILDCPVGTGRFLDVYRQMGIFGVGIDSSDEMLREARKKPRSKFSLIQGSADKIDVGDKHFEVCVCVRFFNLIEPEALRKCFAELSRVTRKHMICTVRLGPEYYSNSAMCTHSQGTWSRLLTKHGWTTVRDETEPFVRGWHLMLLRKKT